MAYTPYYAPYSRPMNYYNPSIPQDPQMAQSGQPYLQPQTSPAQSAFQAQPASQAPSFQAPFGISPANNDMLWVLNETEATSYPVAPNNSVTLWDKNKDTVYIKSVNAQGIPSMRILDYTERASDSAPKTPENHVCKCASKFVAIEDFKALQAEIEALRDELDELKSKPKTKAIKKQVEEDEDNA